MNMWELTNTGLHDAKYRISTQGGKWQQESYVAEVVASTANDNNQESSQ